MADRRQGGPERRRRAFIAGLSASQAAHSVQTAGERIGNERIARRPFHLLVRRASISIDAVE